MVRSRGPQVAGFARFGVVIQSRPYNISWLSLLWLLCWVCVCVFMNVCNFNILYTYIMEYSICKWGVYTAFVQCKTNIINVPTHVPSGY